MGMHAMRVWHVSTASVTCTMGRCRVTDTQARGPASERAGKAGATGDSQSDRLASTMIIMFLALPLIMVMTCSRFTLKDSSEAKQHLQVSTLPKESQTKYQYVIFSKEKNKHTHTHTLIPVYRKIKILNDIDYPV